MKLFILLTLGFLSTAIADNRPYGTGGCGLGSVIIGKKDNQIVAMTLNAIGTQTFAISSGTSNCVDHGVVRRDREARAYIEINRLQLANDIAQGGGETVTSLAGIYECTNAKKFGQALKSHYENIFPTNTSSADQVESGIHAAMESDLTLGCRS